MLCTISLDGYPNANVCLSEERPCCFPVSSPPLPALLIPIIILLLLLPNACYVVEQQHAVIIERLGKFNRIVNAGFHVKVPVIDRKAATVSLRTMKKRFWHRVKTQDNVTIGLEVSAQYHVSYDMGAGPADSGIYKSYYMLQEPVDQMRDFINRRPALFDSCLHTR